MEYAQKTISIGRLHIDTIRLSHPNQGIGYSFSEDGRRFVFLTDNELSYIHEGGCDFEEYCEFCRGADLFIHDSEYTEEEYVRTRTWGHSTYQDAMLLAFAAGVKRFGLFHHNQDRSDQEIEAIVYKCQERLASLGASIECFATAQGMEIRL